MTAWLMQVPEFGSAARLAHFDSGTSRLAGEASASLRIPIGTVYARPERAISP